MVQAAKAFKRDFYRALLVDTKDPRHEDYYVPIHDGRLDSHDPIEGLATGIEYSPGESVQLLSGFKGTGKSTELRRLERRLTEAGYLVVLRDAEEYVNLSERLDVSDFLMAVAGALGDGLRAPDLLGDDPGHEGYWSRLVGFLTRTRVDLPEVDAAGFKASLQLDPAFKRRVQERMAGHLAALVADTRAYVEECVRRVRKRHGVDAEVVLLLDSVEHIRGTLNNERQVQESVAMLFGGHADKLHLPHLHVVYTVPAYLKVLRPGIGGLYSPGGLELLPAVKVRSRTGDGVHRPGLDALEAIVRARGDWQRLLGGREVLDELCVLSGGDLRDLFRLLREVIASARELPAAPDLVHDAVSRIRSGYLPIADADVVRLARIAETHSASLESVAGLPDFARFLETHLVLCYRNDEDWYDVHPLVADHVVGRARRIREAERAAGDG